MKLILHIGTHKTGTTALQQFLHANRRRLAARGFHYATPPHGLQHSNLVSNALTAGESPSVEAFLTKTHGDGPSAWCSHTSCLSGEFLRHERLTGSAAKTGLR